MSQYQLRRAWVQTRRYRVTAFPSPIRIPVCQRLVLVLSTGGDVLRRQRGVESSNAPPSCFFGSGSREVPLLPYVWVNFRSHTPIAPEGELRKRSARPDGGRSAPRNLRCGLWSCTRIYAYEDLWERRGGMRMGPPRGWRACSMVGRTGSSVRRRMCNRREERTIGLEEGVNYVIISKRNAHAVIFSAMAGARRRGRWRAPHGPIRYYIRCTDSCGRKTLSQPKPWQQ